MLGARLGGVNGSTYILKRFAHGQGVIWRLHHFLDQFRTRRDYYPSPESGNPEQTRFGLKSHQSQLVQANEDQGYSIYLFVPFFEHESSVSEVITESGEVREKRITKSYGGDSIELCKMN